MSPAAPASNPSPDDPRRSRVTAALAVVGILLAAANLRTAVASLSPVYAEVARDIDLGAASIGVLGTLPPLCFAIAGLCAPLIRRWASAETLLVLGLATILIGHLSRSLAPDSAALIAASTVTFLATGIANVMLPPVVKSYLPRHVGLMTSLYATTMTLFSLVPPLVAVPAVDAVGWRATIGVWAVLAALAVVPWVVVLVRDRAGAGAGAGAAAGAATTTAMAAAAPASDGGARANPPAPRIRVTRSPLAWAMAVLFGMTAGNVFAMFAWLPEILTETASVSSAGSGALLSLYAAIGVPLSLAVPVLATRMRSITPLVALGAAAYLAGYAGLLVAPAAAPVLWVALAALGPLLFPLTLVLINLRTRTTAGSTALSGFTQGLGYLIGAAGPLLVGVLHDSTGSWTAPLILLACSVVPALVTGIRLSRPRFLEPAP